MQIDIDAYYRKYGPMVYRRCKYLLRDEEAAMDAMQDTFVKLLRYRGRLTHQAPSSLLYTMATNVCLNKIRSKRRRPEHADADLLARIAAAENVEPRIAARSALGRLFEREKASTGTIAVLHLLDGMTLEEVAREVGMSVSGVRKRLRPLKGRLAELEGVVT